MLKLKPTLLASAISLALASAAMAGEIQTIDQSNFGPAGDVFRTLYDRDVTGGTTGAVSYGEIGWDVLKAVDPGIIVYNNVPTYAASQIIADCVMAPRIPALWSDLDGDGINETDKRCNDGFQSHKRYKMSATGVGPIDLVFTVDAADGAADQDATRNIYRMIGKLNNHTAGRLGGFRVELGFGVGAGFVPSTAVDGLNIALHQEGDDPSVDPSVNLGDNDMAEFPGGLFYNGADPDAKHGFGFFSDARAYFAVNTAGITGAGEDGFGSTALSANYTTLFGEWLPIEWVPQGWFLDNDGNPATDNLLQAWNNGTAWLYGLDPVTGALPSPAEVGAATLANWAATPPTVYDGDGDTATSTDGVLYATWNPETELYELAAGGTATNDEMTAAIAASGTLERRAGYQQGPIEDLANLNLNYYIEVADITGWPSYNAGAATFTLRITPIAAASNDVPAWVPVDEASTTPAASSGGGGGCALGNGRSGFDPVLPGLALAGLGYLALRRRPGGSVR
ncbi:MAG: choice-of-anchor F family protein [Gammaproteobacteria bacterium]|nr:choice-of-anchor F family protein [Gammaproteobacteria bacterium]